MHFGAQLRKIERFLAGSISSTYDGNIHTAVEETVAYSTCADPMSVESLFRFKTEPFGFGSRGKNYSICGDTFGSIYPDFVRSYGEIYLIYITVAKISTKPFCLGTQVFHHLRTENAFGIARKIFYVGGIHQLSAGSDSGNQHRLEVCPGGIDGCGVTCRA